MNLEDWDTKDLYPGVSGFMYQEDWDTKDLYPGVSGFMNLEDWDTKDIYPRFCPHTKIIDRDWDENFLILKDNFCLNISYSSLIRRQ